MRKWHEWRSMEERPDKDGAYLVYAATADPLLPMVMIYYDQAEDRWHGLVPYWMRALTHWMPLPTDPATEGKRLEDIDSDRYPLPPPLVITNSHPLVPRNEKIPIEDLMEIICEVSKIGYSPSEKPVLYYREKETEDAH